MRASDHRFGLAAEAYIFGYPLVSSVRLQTRLAVDGVGTAAGRGFNSFYHQRELPGPNSEFVNVDGDLLSSMAQVDLTPGPFVLHVPDVGDRYFLLMFVDAWRNTFSYLGSGSGGGGGSYVLVPPGWPGRTPPTMTRIDAPTRLLTVLGRIGLADPREAAEVYRLQNGLHLHALDPDARLAEGPPERSKSVCDDLRFWEELRIWLRAFPPPPAEFDHARRYAPLGIFEDPSPYVDPDPSLTWSLRGGLRAGRDGLERLAQVGRAQRNGWSSAPHALDFNLDFLGPGTRDEPAWRMVDREQARIARAMAARSPFGPTHGYQSVHATCLVDGEGRRLTGAHRYTMDLAPPPAAMSWTLTMYDAPGYYLVDNPLSRYWLGSRTDGLRVRRDGSVRVLIQCDPPAAGADEEEQANWLPAAPGDFRPMLRLDCPAPETLERDIAPPSIQRID
ncbi:conserved hypothetical protein [Frankia canadensis]|uniref:DUF1254 domain-containing protein n=1 Tax=Frankia canadensis TaxID=1836972 RepID=A0A2I2KNJ9_9ACTN|nr:DUF1254 domain-containing protein [Frankia canadensis]SNQ47243.1 conserved hypothetical protein [Frankia canadensis]SOU54533.1 conserved hypothetical protein [Frankia canadensis]